MDDTSDKPERLKPGAKPKDVSIDKALEYARLGLNIGQIAAALGVSRDTLTRRMDRRDLKAAFAQAQAAPALALVRVIWDEALNNRNTAMIKLLANVHLGWNDKISITGDFTQTQYVVEIPSPQTEEQWLQTWGSDGWYGKHRQMEQFAQQPEPMAPEPVVAPEPPKPPQRVIGRGLVRH